MLSLILSLILSISRKHIYLQAAWKICYFSQSCLQLRNLSICALERFTCQKWTSCTVHEILWLLLQLYSCNTVSVVLTTLWESHWQALSGFSNLLFAGNRLPYAWVSPDTFNLFALKMCPGRASGTVHLSRIARHRVSARLPTTQKSLTRILHICIPNLRTHLV